MAVPLLQSDIRNTLLSTLSPSDFAALQPHLGRQSLDQGFVVETADQAITHVHFPEPGVISVVARTGRMRLEAGLIGPEGMTGLPLLNGVDRSPNETFVQIACRSWCVDAGVLQGVLGETRSVHAHLLRYAQTFSVQVAQTVLVNGCFTVGERLARWLLMCHDRVDREDLPLTHEFLSIMLGVRRAGVTTALQVLEGAKAVTLRRSSITVSDRSVLLDAAGDSYGVPEAEYIRVMGSA